MALFCVVIGLVPGYFVVKLRWVSNSDFDVTGVLFLMQNLPRLTAIIALVVAFGGAVSLWVRSLSAE